MVVHHPTEGTLTILGLIYPELFWIMARNEFELWKGSKDVKATLSECS